MNVEAGLPIGDLMDILRRRAGLIAAIAGGIFLTAYWISMAIPNQYQSYATILVEPQTVSDQLVEAGVADSDLNNRLHLMTAEILSRPRLSKVIDDLQLYREESKTMLREEIIDLMRSKIRVAPLLPELEAELDRKRTELQINTFQIFYTADSAVTAAKVAQRLAEGFVNDHLGARTQLTRKSLEFMQAERVRLGDRLANVELRISDVKEASPGRLPEDLEANQRLQERTLAHMRDVRRELDLARSDASYWANQSIASHTRINDDADPIRRMQLLEFQLAEHRSRGFTDKHPDVRATMQEITRLRDDMRVKRSAGRDADAPVSFAEQSVLAEEGRAKLRVAAAEVEVARLEQELASIEARMADTPKVAEALDGLQREWEELYRSEQDFAKRGQEASVQADLERRQLGEQFRILEPAFPPTEPSSPRRALILLIGVFLGIAVGGFTGFLIETTDTSLHRARELQSALGIPVLASIPAIVLESDRAQMARQRIRHALLASAVVAACLVGGAVTYLVVNGRTELSVPSNGSGIERPAAGAQGSVGGFLG